jgi:hypothetical protein
MHHEGVLYDYRSRGLHLKKYGIVCSEREDKKLSINNFKSEQ